MSVSAAHSNHTGGGSYPQHFGILRQQVHADPWKKGDARNKLPPANLASILRLGKEFIALHKLGDIVPLGIAVADD